MTRLILIPTGQTDWVAEGRVIGDTDLPLNELGRQEAMAAAQAAAVHRPEVVYCGAEEASKATAKIIAHELTLKYYASDKLREVSLGHWQGLTEEEFGERFAKVYRQWRTEPMSVIPPEGESLSDAVERLRGALDRTRRRNKDKVLAVVLGRLAYALCRCTLAENGFDRFWEFADPRGEASVYEIPDSNPPSSDSAGVKNPDGTSPPQ